MKIKGKCLSTKEFAIFGVKIDILPSENSIIFKDEICTFDVKSSKVTLKSNDVFVEGWLSAKGRSKSSVKEIRILDHTINIQRVDVGLAVHPAFLVEIHCSTNQKTVSFKYCVVDSGTIRVPGYANITIGGSFSYVDCDINEENREVGLIISSFVFITHFEFGTVA